MVNSVCSFVLYKTQIGIYSNMYQGSRVLLYHIVYIYLYVRNIHVHIVWYEATPLGIFWSPIPPTNPWWWSWVGTIFCQACTWNPSLGQYLDPACVPEILELQVILLLWCSSPRGFLSLVDAKRGGSFSLCECLDECFLMMWVTIERKPPGLLHHNNKITCNSSISGTQAGSRYWPSDGFHVQAWQKIVPTHDHHHGLVGGIGDQKIPSGTESW